jgi:competence protein ComEC
LPNPITQIIEPFTEQRKRWFLWSPVWCSFGVGLYFNLTWQPSLGYISPTVLLLFLWIALRFRSVSDLFQTFVTILLLFSVGFTASIIREELVKAPVLQKRSFVSATATVVSVSRGLKKEKIVFKDLIFSKAEIPNLKTIRVSNRIRKTEIAPGDRVAVSAILLPPPPPAYPGAYDFQRDLYFKGIGAVGFTIRPMEILPSDNEVDFSPLKWIEQIRFDVNRSVQDISPEDTAGFALAIMTGDRQLLSKKVVEDMRASGLAHLLAISGLHMGMFGGIIFFSIRFGMALMPKVALSQNIKKWAALGAILGLCGYLSVSGMSISATRAFLMILLVFLAVCFDRTAISLRNIAFAALCILLLKPESLLGASFQMSFAAVFCLIAIYEQYGTAYLSRSQDMGVFRKSAHYLTGIVATSLIATIATAPFAIYHFGQLALLGVGANLVAVPLMGLWVMPWILITFIAMPFGLVEFPLAMASIGIRQILKIADLTASAPVSTFSIGSYSSVLLIAIIVAAMWVFVWRGRLRVIAVPILIFGVATQMLQPRPDILMSGSGKLSLVKVTENEPFVSTLRAEKFERIRWAKMFGYKDLREVFNKQNEYIKCDVIGCLWEIGARKIAFSKNTYSLSQDCKRVDILLSPYPVSDSCDEPQLVIDKFDLWRNGTHALYLSNNEIKIETVNGVRGYRPWVPEKFTSYGRFDKGSGRRGRE